MPRKKAPPAPAGQDEINELQDRYRDERAPIVDAYEEARRTGNTERALELWSLWKHIRAAEHEAVLDALHPRR